MRGSAALVAVAAALFAGLSLGSPRGLVARNLGTIEAPVVRPAPVPPPTAGPPPPALPPGSIPSPILTQPGGRPFGPPPVYPAPAYPTPLTQQQRETYRTNLVNRRRGMERNGVSPANPRYRDIQQQLNQLGR